MASENFPAAENRETRNSTNVILFKKVGGDVKEHTLEQLIAKLPWVSFELTLERERQKGKKKIPRTGYRVFRIMNNKSPSCFL